MQSANTAVSFQCMGFYVDIKTKKLLAVLRMPSKQLTVLFHGPPVCGDHLLFSDYQHVTFPYRLLIKTPGPKQPSRFLHLTIFQNIPSSGGIATKYVLQILRQ